MQKLTNQTLAGLIVKLKLPPNLANEQVEEFFQEISHAKFDHESHVIVDCSELGRISDVQAADILAARKKAKHPCRNVYLTHLQSSLSDGLFETRLGRLLAVFQSNQHVLQYLATHRPSYG